MARQIGRAPRVLSGWVPTADDPSEWNVYQREMMFALVEAEADICPGCGGFLSFSTVRNHAVAVSRRQCEHCAALDQANEQWNKQDEKEKGLPDAWVPSARRTSVRPVPLTPEQKNDAEMGGIYGTAREEE